MEGNTGTGLNEQAEFVAQARCPYSARPKKLHLANRNAWPEAMLAGQIRQGETFRDEWLLTQQDLSFEFAGYKSYRECQSARKSLPGHL